MKKFFIWCGTVIEDKQGSISSKRVGFFWCLFILTLALDKPDTNEVVIWSVAALAFGLVGLTIPEWFSKISKPKTVE